MLEDLVGIVAVVCLVIVIGSVIQNVWVPYLCASAALFQRFTASLLSNIVKIKLYIRLGDIERNGISYVPRLPLHSHK